MHKIGFVGLGHLGYALLLNFLNSGTLKAENVIIFNRTVGKAESIKELFPELTIAANLDVLFKQVSIVISSVSAMAQKSILEKIPNNKIHFISVSNGLKTQEMSKIYKGRITRIMPTVTMGGYTLITKGSEDLNQLFSGISSILFINESEFDLFTLITGCGPGLFSSILEQFAKSFSNRTDIGHEVISDLLNKTFMSTLNNITSESLDYSSLINRVATKGGLTEVGVEVIRNGLPGVIDDLIDKSLEYNKKITDEINF